MSDRSRDACFCSAAATTITSPVPTCRDSDNNATCLTRGSIASLLPLAWRTATRFYVPWRTATRYSMFACGLRAHPAFVAEGDHHFIAAHRPRQEGRVVIGVHRLAFARQAADLKPGTQ